MTQEFWYLSRAAGFTAYLLLFVSVALGIAIGTRLADRIAKRNVIFDLHRFATIMALAFSLFHVYVLLLDGFFNFNVWELSVPFLSPYRAWQTAAGVFALYALGLLILSFYVRQFIGYRAWRAIHFVTFAMFAAVALHGITAGTDTTEAWAKGIYVVTGAATVALIMYRVQYRIPDTSTMRTVRLSAGVATVTVVALLLFTTGLFSTGAAPAKTQADVASNEAVPAQAGATGVPYPFLASFDNDFSGNYSQTQDATGSHLTIDGATAGDLPARLHVELVRTAVVPTPDNEVNEHEVNDSEDSEARPKSTVTTNTAELRDPTSDAVLCTGTLTALDDGYMRATCDGSGPYQGVRISISSRIQAGADGSLTGALSGKMQRLS
jgi:sulfoxide reductase heme-binding subunit YedZ